MRHLLVTALIILVYILGMRIPLPFVEITKQYRQLIAQSSLPVIGVISGANVTNLSLFSVGLNPFMIALLIIQILIMTKWFGFDAFSQTQTEVVQQILLLLLSVGQSAAFTWSLISTKNLLKNLTITLLLTSGSLLVYWLCLMNIRFGIGKMAPIMLVNIINSSATSFFKGFKLLQKNQHWPINMCVTLVLMCVLIFIWVGFTRAYYPLQEVNIMLPSYSKPVLVPLSLNMGAMMTYMIGMSILMLPSMLATHFSKNYLINNYYFNSVVVFVISFFLFYFFSFFQYSPEDQAKNLRDANNYLLGIRPGKPTKQYLTQLLIKILFPGAFTNALIITISLFGSKLFGEKANFTLLLANFAMISIFFLSIMDEVNLYLFPLKYKKINRGE